MRPDLRADTRPWTYLLTWAALESGADPDGAYGALSLVRAYGARLVADAAGNLRIDGSQYQSGPAWSWERDRQHLLPFRGAIARWLRLLAEGERANPLPAPMPQVAQ